MKTYREVGKAIGLNSRTAVYNRVVDGLLPKPVRVGERAVRFVPSEIDAVLAAMIAGRSNDEIRALVVKLTAQRSKALQAVEV